jgi:hypothetical protein
MRACAVIGLLAVSMTVFTAAAQAHGRIDLAGAALERTVRILAVGPVRASCPAGVPVQTISVVNRASVRPVALARVETATTKQSLQLRAAWGTPCAQFARPGGWVVTLTAGASTVNPDGSVSYNISSHHDYNAGVVSITVQTAGTTYETWARAFTHEIDETLVDPNVATYWQFGLLEVCDPVEEWTYQLDGVPVSDFALPSYFNGGAGPWDEMGGLSGPSTALG